MAVVVAILLFTALFLILLYYVTWRCKQMSILERNGIKGPKPHFVYGNIAEMSKNGNVETHEKWKKEYGPIYGYYIGRQPAVAVTEQQLLKQIQIKEFKNFSKKFLPLKDGFNPDPRNNDMLIRVKTQRWKELRTIMGQAFSASKLKNSIGIMDDTVNGLIDSIEKIINEGREEFDIYVLFEGLAMETIARTAFGITTEAQTNPNDPILLGVKSELESTFTSSFLATFSVCFPEFEFVVHPLRRLKEILFPSNLSYLMKTSAAIVESRKANGSNRRADLLQSMLDSRLNFNDFSSIDKSLLSINDDISAGDKEHTETPSDKKQTYKAMTDDEIVANTVLFLEAGYETISSSLAFVMHALVNHRDVQEQVREEVMQLLKKEGKLDYNTVTELPFMEAVICEMLRIYPITLFVTRVAEVNYKYKDITIPKESCIIVPLYQLHHDPRFWDEPGKFDPYRFYGDNRSKANDLIWQPFGAGPRNCIGMRFAICEMKLALAKLLYKYRFEAGPRTEIGDITVRQRSIGMCPNHVFVKAVRF